MTAFRNALPILCSALLAALGLCPSAAAATLADLATGKAADGSLIPTGQLDDQWTLVSAPTGASTGAARVIGRNPSWFDANPDAQWISTQSAASGGTNLPVGDYVFRFTFSVASVSAGLSLSAEYGSDNLVTSVTLNGNALTLDNPNAQFGTPWPGSFSTNNSSLFVAGLNTLDVTVNNAGTSPNPAGLAIRGSVLLSVTVPEPAPSSSWLLWGCLALATARLRLRR